MKSMKFIFMAAALLTLAGCRVLDIDNGEIPDNYLSQAKQFEGVYEGQFNGVPGEMTVSFEGNKPVLSYKNAQGSDILNNNCGSSFGLLKKVYLRGTETPRIDAVSFAFQPGQCALTVDGRDVTVELRQYNGKTVLKLSLLRNTTQQRVCDWSPGAPNMPPQQVCRWEQTPVYLYGKFAR
jgi:hypothetical protein